MVDHLIDTPAADAWIADISRQKLNAAAGGLLKPLFHPYIGAAGQHRRMRPLLDERKYGGGSNSASASSDETYLVSKIHRRPS
jgi:hypothetical protein